MRRLLAVLLALLAFLALACVPPVHDGGRPPHPDPDVTRHSMYEWAWVLIRVGFRDPVTGVAVIWAESRGDDNARNLVYNLNSPAHMSYDEGGWQINNWWHRARITTACADQMLCSSVYAKSISAGGSDYRLWTTFFNGSHRQFMDAAARAVWDATVDYQRGL